MAYLRPFLLSLLLILIYLGAWRTVRVFLTSELIFPMIETRIGVDSALDVMPKKGASLVLRTTESDSDYVFSGFGNSFFLLGALYFLAFGFGCKPVGWLFLLHLGITALSLICLFLAVSTHPAWLYPMNLLVTYITPAATGMFVLTVGRRR